MGLKPINPSARKPAEYRILSSTRHHGLRHHGLNHVARSQVHCGAGVDALVDQLRLTGVNPDAQDDQDRAWCNSGHMRRHRWHGRTRRQYHHAPIN